MLPVAWPHFTMRPHRFIAASLAAFVMAGCAQLAVISEKRPAPLPPGSGAETIDRALVEEKKQPIVALGGFVAAA
jgi:hypothetical protein